MRENLKLLNKQSRCVPRTIGAKEKLRQLGVTWDKLFISRNINLQERMLYCYYYTYLITNIISYMNTPMSNNIYIS